jgi:transposase-like protein
MEAGDVRRFERRSVDHSGLTFRVHESAVEVFPEAAWQTCIIH